MPIGSGATGRASGLVAPGGALARPRHLKSSLSTAPPAITGTVAISQSAAVEAVTLREDFRLSVAVAQAAAVEAATLREDFRFSVAAAQAAGAISATLREDFRLAGTVSQAAASMSATLREDFRGSAAVAQAAGVESAALHERFIASTVAPTQAAAAVSATAVERFILASVGPAQTAAAVTATGTVSGGVVAPVAGHAGRAWRASLRAGPASKPITVPIPAIAAVSVTISTTQAAATISAIGETREDETWLLLAA